MAALRYTVEKKKIPVPVEPVRGMGMCWSMIDFSRFHPTGRPNPISYPG